MVNNNSINLSDFKTYDDFKTELTNTIILFKKNKVKRLYILNNYNHDYINKEIINLINKNGLSIIINMFNSDELIVEFN